MKKTIAKPILNLLDKNTTKYELINHRQVFTARDKAATLKTSPKETAKSVILKIDTKECVLVSVPADKNIDLSKLKKFINQTRQKNKEKAAKKISFAPEAWFRKNLKNSEPGAVVPLGSFYKIKNIFDPALLKQKNLVLNGGSNWQSIKISPAQLIKIEGEWLVKTNVSSPRPKKKSKKKK